MRVIPADQHRTEYIQKLSTHGHGLATLGMEYVNVNEYPGTKGYPSTAQQREVAAVFYAAGCESSFLRHHLRPYACDDPCSLQSPDGLRSCVYYRHGHHPHPIWRTGIY
jgi:hypothetical protein